MAVTDQQIVDYLTSNPNLTSQELSAVMAQYGVSPEQVVNAIGATGNAPVNIGGTYFQPIYSQTGSGMDAQQGPLENLVTYKANDNQVGGNVNWFDPTGAYQQTTKQQEVNANQDFLKFLAGSAALFGGLGGGSLWNGAGGTVADAAAAAADADIAGGLIPEFGTNAAYDAFMSGAMTPAAMTALEELIAANPEILGSGALLTDAAAGLTPTVTTTGGTANVVTTPTTPTTTTATPVTTTTTTPTVTTTPNITDLTKVLTPSVIASLGGLLGGTVLSKAAGSGGSSAPVSVPTQGVPLNSQDYYNAIQQNYNQIMPNVPRDVATPLAAWYNSKYGA
jgi:hypothetical protein